MKESEVKLKQLLDELYRSSESIRYIKNDPIEFPGFYKNSEDIEIAGLVASSLAYGRVSLFKPIIGKLLEPAKFEGLHKYILDLDVDKERQRLSGVKYRMNSSDDLVCFLYLIQCTIKKYGSIGGLFVDSYRLAGGNLKEALNRLVSSILSFDTTPVYGADIRPGGLKFLLPQSAKGSACKRLNLYLRWMIRADDGVDFGLWDIPTDKLIVPVDTHIAFVCYTLGLTGKKSSSWNNAVEITEKLKEFDPADPVKYDFVLAHTGISNDCQHKQSSVCSTCYLADFCIILNKTP